MAGFTLPCSAECCIWLWMFVGKTSSHWCQAPGSILATYSTQSWTGGNKFPSCTFQTAGKQDSRRQAGCTPGETDELKGEEEQGLSPVHQMCTVSPTGLDQNEGLRQTLAEQPQGYVWTCYDLIFPGCLTNHPTEAQIQAVIYIWSHMQQKDPCTYKYMWCPI